MSSSPSTGSLVCATSLGRGHVKITVNFAVCCCEESVSHTANLSFDVHWDEGLLLLSPDRRRCLLSVVLGACVCVCSRQCCCSSRWLSSIQGLRSPCRGHLVPRLGYRVYLSSLSRQPLAFPLIWPVSSAKHTALSWTVRCVPWFVAPASTGVYESNTMQIQESFRLIFPTQE